ncbi:GAF and ANTAR domain-containing protein [Streptomyces sp. PmtG]
MAESVRDVRVAVACVGLADGLSEDFDVGERLRLLVERCVEFLDVAAVGVILAAPEDGTVEVAASHEPVGRLERLAVEWDEGPCRASLRTGEAVAEVGLGVSSTQVRWPRFCRHAAGLGFASVAATPLRLREQTIGALSLFRQRPEPLPAPQLRFAGALAELATIGILHRRTAHRQALLIGQLETALRSRVVIEQAKGALAQLRRISVDEAFTLLRRHARAQRRLLTTVAEEVLSGTADPSLLGAGE